MRKTLTILLLATACNSSTPTERSEAAEPTVPENAGVKQFGEPITAGKTVPLQEVLAKAAAFEKKPILVEGKVKAVCEKKGCWMELADGDASCRVTFKGYGFFVPKDSAGANARVQGEVSISTISKADVEHYEAEGATFAEKLPDGRAHQVAIVASGVELQRP